MLLGIVSDTHSLLRSKVKQIFRKCNLIIHAGDIGSIRILRDLEKIAPAMAVRGNTDTDSCFDVVPETRTFVFCGIPIYVIHDLSKLDIDPDATGVQVIISGHTHKPNIFKKNEIIYVNPGSAGYHRVNCSTTLILLSAKNGFILNISIMKI